MAVRAQVLIPRGGREEAASTVLTYLIVSFMGDPIKMGHGECNFFEQIN